MTTRIRRAVATLSLAAAGPAALLISGSPAQAATVSSSAYWVKFDVPVPIVPTGGLLVANDPTTAFNLLNPIGSAIPIQIPQPSLPGIAGADIYGPTAISALQLIDVGTGDVTLTLDVAAGSVVLPTSLGIILACPLGNALRPPPGGKGDIATAPGYDCQSGSQGMVASGNGSISWDLPASFQSTPGQLAIALVPDPAVLPIPYEVAFDAPKASDIMPSSGPAYVPPTVPMAPPVGLPSSPQAAGPVASTILGGASTPLSTPIASSTAQPAPTATGGQGIGPTILPAARPVDIRLPGDDRAHRIMAVVLLILLAAALWYFGSAEARGPRLLGSLAGDDDATRTPVVQEGGIGRFSRPRTSRARRL